MIAPLKLEGSEVERDVSEFHEYVGNLHIHSRFSDGSGSVAQIIRAARGAGLDFIAITDHRTMAARPAQGWHGDLLVLVGEELGLESGHYVGFGLRAACGGSAPREMLREVRDQGGVGFIAHPDDNKFGWPDWRAEGYDGISLWNFTSQWRWSLGPPLKTLAYVLFPARAVTAPPRATLARWDALQRGRLVPAIGSSDAHAFGWRPLGLPLVILPYRLLFRAVNTHVLLEQGLTNEAARDEGLILDALRRGSCYVANDRRGPARGFRFRATGRDGSWSMGRTVPPGAAQGLEIELPAPGWISLLRDGRPWRSSCGRGLRADNPPPGIYRVEVYRDEAQKWGWIFSNAIRVT